MKTAITPINPIDVMVKTPKGFTALNAPKPNSVAIACGAIAAIARKAAVAEGLTPFGHKANAKNGIIDMTILSGRVHTIESFIDALDASGLKVVEDDRKEYPSDTFRAVLAKRVTEHVGWCASTSNNSHGGFGHRLAKVGLAPSREELAGLLNELSGLLHKQYAANYAPLYNARKK